MNILTGNKNPEKKILLSMTCPICGSVMPIEVGLDKLRELFIQDFPVYDIFKCSRLESCRFLAGICPVCWEKIMNIKLTDEFSCDLIHRLRLEFSIRKDEKAGRKRKIIKRSHGGRKKKRGRKKGSKNKKKTDNNNKTTKS